MFVGLGLLFSYSICAENGDPVFQLKNKSKLPINFRIIQEGSVLTIQEDLVYLEGPASGWVELKPDESKEYFTSALDLSKHTQMELNYCKSKDDCPTARKHKPMPYTMMVEFTPNKTIYIKWDGKTIKPQMGGVGIKAKRKKTIDGYSLENNVTRKDIKIEQYAS
jgi:hypothetical protein